MSATIEVNDTDDESGSKSLPAFAGYGIELEYMIVDRNELSVLPIADQLLRPPGGVPVCNIERGEMGWSNELVLHLIEIKNQQPVPSIGPLAGVFHSEIRYINRMLELYGAQLMPTAMHPWMDPRRETRLWPHDNAEIYQAYARIFDCNTHGWANLQSMHLNLPFADDEQFARLHAAVRLALPIIPALAASSPIAEGADTGFADFRMEVYSTNAQQFPSISGQMVPETVSSEAEYQQRILAPMYRDIAPFDPQGTLQAEWLNSRGAIVRFDRHAIEIRVIDTQECPQADLAIAAAVVALVRLLYEAGGSANTLKRQQQADTGMLAGILADCIRDADQALIANAGYLALLGYPQASCSAAQLWRHLAGAMQRSGMLPEPCRQPLQLILERGPLARRILRALDGNLQSRLHPVYQELCDCLHEGRMFDPR